MWGGVKWYPDSNDKEEICKFLWNFGGWYLTKIVTHPKTRWPGSNITRWINEYKLKYQNRFQL